VSAFFIIMAAPIGGSIETLSNQERIDKLAAANSDTDKYLSDQMVFQYGTNRKSELAGIIGDSGDPWEKLLNDSINGL
jgi:hypothetical protein